MIRNEFMPDEGAPPQIILSIDASLLDYFRSGMLRNRLAGQPLAELTRFLADVLNDTTYPIEAHLLDTGEIRLSYQPRAFADPIF